MGSSNVEVHWHLVKMLATFVVIALLVIHGGSVSTRLFMVGVRYLTIFCLERAMESDGDASRLRWISRALKLSEVPREIFYVFHPRSTLYRAIERGRCTSTMERDELLSCIASERQDITLLTPFPRILDFLVLLFLLLAMASLCFGVETDSLAMH